jgi:hypothetical protein
VLNRTLSSSSSLYGWGSCLALLSYLVPFMFNKVYVWLSAIDSHCMSCQCVACCEVFITKVSLFASSDPVDVSLHDAMVAEAGRLHFRFY